MSNQVEHSDFLCLLLIIYFIIRISFFNYLAKILLGQPRLPFCLTSIQPFFLASLSMSFPVSGIRDYLLTQHIIRIMHMIINSNTPID